MNYENTNLKKEKRKKKEKKRTIHRFAQWNHTGETVPKQFQHSWVALLKVLTNPIFILMLTIILILPLIILITTPSSFQDRRYCLSGASSVQILQHRGHGGDTTLPLAVVARFP